MKLGKRPVPNDKRTVIRFAWIPTVMTNSNIIWLEKYKDHQIYVDALDWWRSFNSEEISKEEDCQTCKFLKETTDRSWPICDRCRGL